MFDDGDVLNFAHSEEDEFVTEFYFSRDLDAVAFLHEF